MITDPALIRRILLHLKLPPDPLPIAPTRDRALFWLRAVPHRSPNRSQLDSQPGPHLGPTPARPPAKTRGVGPSCWILGHVVGSRRAACAPSHPPSPSLAARGSAHAPVARLPGPGSASRRCTSPSLNGLRGPRGPSFNRPSPHQSQVSVRPPSVISPHRVAPKWRMSMPQDCPNRPLLSTTALRMWPLLGQDDWKRLCSKARTICRKYRLGPHDAEDVLQAAILRFSLKPPAETDRLSLIRWFAVTMRRLALDLVRGHHRVAVVLLDEVEDEGDTALSWFLENPLELCIRAEAFQRALARIATAPPPFRQILELLLRHRWTRPQVVAWLSLWRPVGSFEAERLVDAAHLWFTGGIKRSAKRNPWISIPPPLRSLVQWRGTSLWGMQCRAPEFPIKA